MLTVVLMFMVMSYMLYTVIHDGVHVVDVVAVDGKIHHQVSWIRLATQTPGERPLCLLHKIQQKGNDKRSTDKSDGRAWSMTIAVSGLCLVLRIGLASAPKNETFSTSVKQISVFLCDTGHLRDKQ